MPKAVVNKLLKEDTPAELRNATVIFIKIMPLKGEMIPIEDYHEFYMLVQKWVYEFGGVINKIDYTDKGYLLLVLFGVPSVHPDDVERAFLCALRITQNPFSKVQCRIGITSSNIYCGVIGSSLSYEYGIIGNAVNIAARLMSQAEWGQIALSADILPAIASRFKTRFVQCANVKGIKEPIQIHLLESELPEHWAFYNEKFRDLPLVLSSAQMEVVQSFTGAETAVMLKITGGKGSGKSFLIWQLWHRLQQQGKNPEIIMVDRHSQNLRLEFFFSLGRRVLGISSYISEFERLNLLAAKHHLDWNEGIIMRYLFPGSGDGSLKPEETVIATECLTGMCMYLLNDHDSLLVDNYDLYDKESQSILIQIALRFLAEGKKIAVSIEDSGFTVGEGFPLMGLELQELTLEQSQNLLGHTLPLITQKAKILLHEISSGNPQFLVGMVEQIKSKYDTSSDLISDNTIIDLQAKGIISTNLENMLMANYEALDADSQSLLRYAAVYGSPFSIADLQKAFGIKAQFPMQETIASLRQELYLELVVSGKEPRFSFSNSLLRDSIYRSILLGEKKDYHRQIAASLAMTGTEEDELLEQIVYHYLQAEEREPLVHWSRIAAIRFFNAGAWDSSRRYYQILQNWEDNHDEVISARMKLAELSLMQANNAEAKEILDSLPKLQDSQSEYAIYLNTVYLNNTAAYQSLQDFLKDKLPTMQNQYFKSLVYVYYLESMLYANQNREFIKEALAAYPKMQNSPALQNRLAGVIGQAYINQGDYRLAYEYYAKKRELATSQADGLGLRIALNGMGGACYRMGKKTEAWELYQEALKVAEQTGDRNGYSKVMLNLGVSLKSEMRYDEAQECYNKAMLLAKKMGNLMQESILIFDMGEIQLVQGKYEEALPFFIESLEIAKRINDYTGISFCNDAIGDCYFTQGNYARAEETYLANLELQIQINDREGMGHTWGNLGNCALQKKNYPEARKYYYMQFKMCSKLQDWDGAGRSRYNLALVNKERGYYKRALAQVQVARELFTRCQATLLLQKSNSLIAEISTLVNYSSRKNLD
ncbi:MAG: tetratricopeptide repeat protein [Candidatus Cloacimonetes bacterium]|nr:tetratricopeptide repeat protein [Candidatus Cloacimonadota bacterium]